MRTRAPKVPAIPADTQPAPPDLRVGTLTVDRILVPGHDGKIALEVEALRFGGVQMRLTSGRADLLIVASEENHASVFFAWDGEQAGELTLFEGKMGLDLGNGVTKPQEPTPRRPDR